MRLSYRFLAASSLLLSGVAENNAGAQIVDSGFPGPNEAFILEVLDAFDRFQRGEAREAQLALTELSGSQEFEGLSDSLKREVYLLLIRAINVRSGRRETIDVVKTITELSSAQPADWISRIELSYSWVPDVEDTVFSLTQLLRNWPEEINGLGVDFVAGTVNNALYQLENEQAYLALVDALIDSDWNVPTNFIAVDELWFRLTLQLIEEGDTDRAAAVASKIRYLPAIIALRSDQRFDAVSAAAQDWFELDAAIEREVSVRRRNADARPIQLAVTNSLIAALIEANRFRDAIDVIGAAARPRGDTDPNTVTGWADETQSLPWFMNHRADILWKIGQRQDALAQLQEARVTFAPADAAHLDQTINLAHYYARIGQSARAIEAVDDLDNLSEFGEMNVRYVRLMAAVYDGNSDTIYQMLQAMERNRDHSLYYYQRALIMAGRIDEAADLLLERLANEETRVGALVEMQIYLDDQVSADAAPLDIRYAEQKQLLLARADVQEAIQSVGRVQSYPIWFTGFDIRVPARR